MQQNKVTLASDSSLLITRFWRDFGEISSIKFLCFQALRALFSNQGVLYLLFKLFICLSGIFKQK